MKKIIRHKTFETNSSSTHAIVISRHNMDEFNYISHIDFDIGLEFGWNYSIYKTINEKANYLYLAIIDCFYDNPQKINSIFDSIAVTLNEVGINCNIPYLTIKDEDVCYNVDGYIDHGNETHDFVNYVLDNPLHLLSYLLSNRSYISTGNDNSSGIYIPKVGYEYDFDDYNQFYDKVEEFMDKEHVVVFEKDS